MAGVFQIEMEVELAEENMMAGVVEHIMRQVAVSDSGRMKGSLRAGGTMLCLLIRRTMLLKANLMTLVLAR
jgi:hypothetical protein